MWRRLRKTRKSTLGGDNERNRPVGDFTFAGWGGAVRLVVLHLRVRVLGQRPGLGLETCEVKCAAHM